MVAGDFMNEVTQWAKQLGETWRVSSQGAVGQTFIWGDGLAKSTYAVIIIN
jgi:hypothetical protein